MSETTYISSRFNSIKDSLNKNVKIQISIDRDAIKEEELEEYTIDRKNFKFLYKMGKGAYGEVGVYFDQLSK